MTRSRRNIPLSLLALLLLLSGTLACRTHPIDSHPRPDALLAPPIQAAADSASADTAAQQPAAPSKAAPPAAPPDPRTVAIQQSPQVQAAIDSLSDRIEAERQRRGVAGLSVSVVYDQSLIWSSGFGTANLETGASATPKTLYRAGSITKLFTDTMLMQLRDAGKVQLDDPVQKYLPEMQISSPYGGRQPTLRQLSSHTGGLPREAPLNYWRTREFPDEQELIGSLQNSSLVGPPGGVYVYSNLGVALEGIALERASGDSYIHYVTEHILKPLGMNDSGFVLSEQARQRLALGSSLATNQSAASLDRYPDFGALAPAAELYTTVEDIGRFMSLQFRDTDDDGGVLSGPSLREMRSAESRGGPSDFAIGWELGGVAGHATIGHPGIVYGFTTQVTLVPDSKLGVAVFTNGRTDPATIANMMLAALLPPVRSAAGG
jgi:CubicO group peptidase (beta-lactamase class C family)